ncbi:MAG TPA: hypothetical protein VFA20_32330 [Myxococcaceae bacterium]|nr:hypothetical protein [Myxococcaceae bacterium]
MARAWGLLLGAGLLVAAPARAHDEKRTDKCGCHHQYGLRHCHPNKATPYCEAPASAKSPDPKAPAPAQKRTRL